MLLTYDDFGLLVAQGQRSCPLVRILTISRSQLTHRSSQVLTMRLVQSGHLRLSYRQRAIYCHAAQSVYSIRFGSIQHCCVRPWKSAICLSEGLKGSNGSLMDSRDPTYIKK